MPIVTPNATAAITDRAQYTGFKSIPDGNIAFLDWVSKITGSDLLDIVSDPATPTFLSAGIYAVSVEVTPAVSLTAGGAMGAFLVLDTGGEAAEMRGTAVANVGVDPAVGVSLTYHVPAGAGLRVQATNADGAATRTFSFQATVQRLT